MHTHNPHAQIHKLDKHCLPEPVAQTTCHISNSKREPQGVHILVIHPTTSQMPKSGIMAQNSFLWLFSNQMKLFPLFQKKNLFSSRLLGHTLGSNVGQELLAGNQTDDRAITDSTASLGPTKRLQCLWFKLAREVPWVKNFYQNKERKNSFQGSLHTHCLLKYPVWNIVGSQEIALDEDAKLSLGSVGGWIVLCIILGFVSSH